MDRTAQSVADHRPGVKMRTGQGPSVEEGGTKGKCNSIWMHHRGRVERNAVRAGDRGLVIAKRLVRREEHQRKANDTAQARTEGRTGCRIR